MEINIFNDKKLKINLPTFIDSRALICANSGGGKSYAVRKLLEESSDKVMAIVLDVEGEFKTLRERFDFLLIGEGGDVNLNMKSANLLPKKIMELEVSTIIDISDLRRNERIKYVKDFLEGLMELPRKKEDGGTYWKPCIVILDEAHMLAGQQEKQDSCSSVIDLMTRGRKRGYCGVLCTQRISKLHKDAVAEANNVMIGRTGLDIDMKRASEILGFTSKQQLLSLRDLEPGEFYVFGTAISRSVTKAKIGEVLTTHPKVGMDLRKEIIKPTEKIVSILSNLKDLPQEAENKLKEVNDYKKEIIELNRKFRVLEHSKPKLEVNKEVLERAYTNGKIIAEEQLNKIKIESNRKFENIKIKINEIGRILEDTYRPISSVSINIPKLKPLIKEKIPITDVNIDGEYELGLCEKKIYSLLYQYSERSFNKPQVGVFTGYSHNSGGFNNAISRLRQLGLVQGSGSALKVLDIKPELVGEFDFSKERIISKLSKCEREIYRVLLQNPEETFGKEELAINTDTKYSSNSGGFNNAISRLNTFGLIKRTNGMIRLNPELLEI